MKNIKRFILSAIALCGVSLIMRTVGVAFGAYVSNRAGAEAMGLYSLLSGVYGFAVTFATSGIGLATTRLVSESIGLGELGAGRAVLRRALLYSLLFGSIAHLGLFLLADPIAKHLLADERATLPLRILSFSLLPISLSSVINGYFTALRKVEKNAAIQLLEQGMRILLISRLLSLLLPRGIVFACVALSLGGVMAECGSFLLGWLALMWENRKKEQPTVKSGTTRRLCGIALPVAVSAYIRSGLLSVEHMLIPRCLAKSGQSRALSLAAFGTLQSMVLPVLLFPAAFLHSFSGLLVPELAECAVKQNRRQIRYISERVMQLSLWFAIGVSGIILCFAREIGDWIYPAQNTHHYLRTLAPLIPIMYLDSAVDAMLKGLGEQVYSMGVNIADSLLSILLILFLLPRFGTEGYILTLYIAELFNAAMSLTRLWQKSELRPQLGKWICFPLLSVIGAVTISNILFRLIHISRVSVAIRTIFHISFTAILYFIFLLFTNACTQDDLCWAIRIFKKEKTGDYP